MVLAAGALICMCVGPVGQRGRAIRAANGGRWGKNTWVALAAALIILVMIVLFDR